MNLYFDRLLNNSIYRIPALFPIASSENLGIVVTDVAGRSPFSVLATDAIPDIHLCASTDTFQCFPFYTYAEDGANRRENITDWALEQFRVRYGDRSITKWDIFHYIYAVLHHPDYRHRCAANLRRELPRIPFAAVSTATLSSRAEQERSLANDPAQSRDPSASSGQVLLSAGAKSRSSSGESVAQANSRSFDSVSGLASESTHFAQDDRVGVAQDDRVGVRRDLEVFSAFVKAGKRLAEIHVEYEKQPEYPLKKTEKAGEKLDYRVTKMRLSKDQDFAHLQPIPDDLRNPERDLRIPPGQPLRVGMGDRSISGLNR